MKFVYVLNAQFLPVNIYTKNCGQQLWAVRAADESQSFCFKNYGGWIRGPTISIAKMPNECAVLSSIKFLVRARLRKLEIYWLN